MAKSLYDILEVSSTASAEAIRASYERLAAKLDPDLPENAGKPDARMQYEAVREAFLTLGNPTRRQRYDASLAIGAAAYGGTIEGVPGFWTTPRLLLVILALVVGGGWYAQAKHAQAKLAAERAIAEAKAREAEAKARAEAEAAQAALSEAQRQREIERNRLYQESRTRNEFERARREVEREQRNREYQERMAQERQAREQQAEARRKEYERQRAETAAVYEARRRVAREREELCRIERERYGRALSC